MNKIGKNYIRSFMKDFLISTLITIYLIIMFMTVFIISNTPLQMYSQYKEITEKSKPWDSSYNDSIDYAWQMPYIGNNYPDSKNDDFFHVMNNLTFDNSNNKDMCIFQQNNTLGGEPWYKAIYKYQLNKNDWEAKDDYKAVNISGFNHELNIDISLLSFINYHSEDSDICDKINNLILYKQTDKDNEIPAHYLKVGEIFNINPQNIEYWKQNSFSVNKILLQKLSSIGDDSNFKEYNLFYNQIFTVRNYISQATSDITSHTPMNGINSDNLKQQLAFTFCDNSYRNGMSDVFLQNKEGRMPENDQEILVNKQFALNNGWKIGDQIKLFGNNPLFDGVKDTNHIINSVFKIVGYGMSLATSDSMDIEKKGIKSINTSNLNYGNIYTTYNEFNKIKSMAYDENIDEAIASSSNILFSGIINWNKNNNKLLSFQIARVKSGNLLSNNPKQIDKIIDNIYDKKYLGTDFNGSLGDEFSSYKNSFVYGQISNNKTNILINFLTLLILSGFSFVFLNLTIKRDISISRRQLGIFKTLGYKTKELAWIYTYKTFGLFLVSSILGYLISIPLQIYTSSFTFKYSIILLTINRYNTMYVLLLIAFLAIPLLFSAFSFLLNLRYLNLDPLKLMNQHDGIKNINFLNISKKIIIRKNNNNVRLKRAFTVKSLWKWFAMFIIFLLSLITLMLSGSASNSLNNFIKNQTTSLYGKQTNNFYVNNQFTNNNISRYEVSSDEEYFKTNEFSIENNPFVINNYKDIQSNVELSLENWHNAVPENDIVKYPYIYLDDLYKYIHLSESNNLSNENDLNYQNCLLNLLYLQYNNQNKNPIISLNKIIDDSNTSLYGIVDELESKNISKKLGKKINIFGWDDRVSYDYFKNYFNVNKISESDYNEVNKLDLTPKEIPIIITSKLSYTLNWKINDVIKENQLLDQNKFTNSAKYLGINDINLKIVGISNDVYNNDVYTGYSNLAKFYVDKNNQNYESSLKDGKYSLFNVRLNNKNLYPNLKTMTDVSNSWLNFYNSLVSGKPPITQDTNIKYYYIATKNNYVDTTSETITDFIQKWKDNLIKNDYFDIPSVVNIPQLNGTIDQASRILKNASLIQEIFLLVLVSILIIILISIIIDENQKIILLLKVLGYKNSVINWVTTGNILAVILVSFVTSITTTYFLLKKIEIIVRKKMNFFISMNLYWPSILEIVFIVFFVSMIIWKTGMNIIKNKKLENLSKID